jgi:hypothetical protein
MITHLSISTHHEGDLRPFDLGVCVESLVSDDLDGIVLRRDAPAGRLYEMALCNRLCHVENVTYVSHTTLGRLG